MGPAQPIAKPVVTSTERIERQYNNVLASRWLGYTVRACLVSSSVTLVILWSTAGFKQTAIMPLAVIALGATVFGVYPVLSAHRLALMYPSPPPSQSTFLALITSELRAQRSWWLVLAHALCGAVFTVAYSLARSLYGVEARLGIFSSTSRHPWHLNERFIYLLSANLTAGMLTAAAHVVQRRITLTWPTTWAPLSTRVRIALAYVSNPFQASSVAVPAAAVVAHALVYGLLRRSVITTALAVLPVLRPFFVNFARSSRSPVWAVRGDVVWLVAMTTIASQVYTRLQNPYLTQPPDFVALIRASPLKPEAYLLDALRIKSTYHLHFTLSELRRFSSDPARRQRLFADVPSSTHAQPTVLNIWEQLLLHLGRRHAALTARTAKRVAPRAAPVADSHTLRTKQADIFRPAAPPKNGVVSALQSVLDGPVAIQPPAVVARSEQLAIEASKAASEAILRAESRVQQRVEGNAWGGLVVSGIKGVWTGSVRTWDAKTRYIGREWAVRGVRVAVRDVELLEGLLDVIVTIAVASLEEDTYGYIQRVLPGTLELIVRHRAELISTRAELLAGSASLGSSAPAAKAEVEHGMGRPIELCERAIQRMGDAFGQTLEAFRFPVAVGRVLTEVCHREEGGEAQEAGRQ